MDTDTPDIEREAPPPPGYRLLTEGERIEPPDLHLGPDGWTEDHLFDGATWNGYVLNPVARKV